MMTNPACSQPIEPVLQAINAATTHLRLYADDHPVVAQGLETAYRELAHLLGSRGDTTLLLIENEWVWKDRPLSMSGQREDRLMKNFEERGIESITFRRNLPREDFFSFLKSMARGENEALRTSETISFGRLLFKRNPAEPPLSPQAEDRFGCFTDMSQKKFEELKTIYHQIVRMKKIDFRGVDDIIQRLHQELCLRRQSDPTAVGSAQCRRIHLHPYGQCLHSHHEPGRVPGVSGPASVPGRSRLHPARCRQTFYSQGDPKQARAG